MAKRRSRKARRAARRAAAGGGTLPYLGRIPLPPTPGGVITPKPRRPDRAAEKQRLRRLAREPEPDPS